MTALVPKLINIRAVRGHFNGYIVPLVVALIASYFALALSVIGALYVIGIALDIITKVYLAVCLGGVGWIPLWMSISLAISMRRLPPFAVGHRFWSLSAQSGELRGSGQYVRCAVGWPRHQAVSLSLSPGISCRFPGSYFLLLAPGVMWLAPVERLGVSVLMWSTSSPWSPVASISVDGLALSGLYLRELGRRGGGVLAPGSESDLTVTVAGLHALSVEEGALPTCLRIARRSRDTFLVDRIGADGGIVASSIHVGVAELARCLEDEFPGIVLPDELK